LLGITEGYCSGDGDVLARGSTGRAHQVPIRSAEELKVRFCRSGAVVSELANRIVASCSQSIAGVGFMAVQNKSRRGGRLNEACQRLSTNGTLAYEITEM
jgi:hypothetical protein